MPSYQINRISIEGYHLSHIHNPQPSRLRNPLSQTGILQSVQSKCNPKTLPTAHNSPTKAATPGPSAISPPTICRLCNNNNPACTVDNRGLDVIPDNVDCAISSNACSSMAGKICEE